ncbi:bile acid:sodium symporter family protein [Roseibium denhamense]|uniref:Bile acid:Na+ symporter, BASS family n=1 Tax=Roseibium denhamense TaxID=76305 RepID=A0ABY1NNU1_9HYPH|nr:bile acid:sodium symporter family protein [Roseibium denhamense]MTI07849.1 bile acid:sodium symporter family protein [Roseibium denhamense]SMP14430.1 bile acid:Na+ symporter, BASS family [Roseibium denhamense]
MIDIDAAVLNFAPGAFWLLNAVLAIVMFSVALDIQPANFRAGLRAPKAFVTGLLSQFLVLPALTFLLVLVVQPRGSVALGLILVAACPGGNISNFITHRAGGNAALAISLTAFTTIGAILLTPLNIAFWGSLYPPARDLLTTIYIDPVQVTLTVSLMLIVPLAAGMAVSHRLPAVSDKLRRPMQQLSMAIYLGFIVVALYANWDFLLAFGPAIIPLVVVHNAIALSGGYLTATLAGLAPYDRRAISIETGIQNSGLGLALIFSFFHGLGGMAIVAAFWGVWHAISGLTIAKVFARTEAAR